MGSMVKLDSPTFSKPIILCVRRFFALIHSPDIERTSSSLTSFIQEIQRRSMGFSSTTRFSMLRVNLTFTVTPQSGKVTLVSAPGLVANALPIENFC